MGRDTGNLKSKHVEKLIQAGKPGKHYDGQGLRLEIKGPKNASWVARYQVEGVTRYMGLGSAKTFNLAEARERNRRLVRQKLADGVDRNRRRASEKVISLAVSARLVARSARRTVEQHNAKWAKVGKPQTSFALRIYAEPIIGNLPVADIDVPLVLKVLEQPVSVRSTMRALLSCSRFRP